MRKSIGERKQITMDVIELKNVKFFWQPLSIALVVTRKRKRQIEGLTKWTGNVVFILVYLFKDGLL
jgi:hypothetical protein